MSLIAIQHNENIYYVHPESITFEVDLKGKRLFIYSEEIKKFNNDGILGYIYSSTEETKSAAEKFALRVQYGEHSV